uniref:Glabrous enhancer-binding protein-like DBD domain-containing protein n=1 Tax=Kalanchoe fedtschenkoi TaxID=63787 RepID=A0A7N0U4P4_KALFE
MAPKKPTPFEQPPRADSSSDDEEEEQESDDSEEEDEQQQPKVVPPAAEKKPVLSKKPEPKPHSSSDEDGSVSGSDSETTLPAADPTINPVPSKPAEDSPKVSSKSKLKKPDAPPPAVSVAGKRPGESKGDVKNTKKSKKVADVEDRQVMEAKKAATEEEVKKVGEDSKKQLFQRLFSEDDEIAVLKGMLEFSAKKGIDPIDDVNGFHDFVKDSIHVDVTSAQLVDKIKRLKKKYENNMRRSKTGVDKTFSKPHEQISYDLSKKIWGFENAKATSASNGGGGGFELKANGKGKRTPKPNMTPDQKEKHASSLQIPKDIWAKNEHEHARSSCASSLRLTEIMRSKDTVGTGLSEEFFKRGLELLGDDVKARLEDRWESLLLAEGELYCQRLELIRDQVKLMLDAYKTSGL